MDVWVPIGAAPIRTSASFRALPLEEQECRHRLNRESDMANHGCPVCVTFTVEVRARSSESADIHARRPCRCTKCSWEGVYKGLLPAAAEPESAMIAPTG